MSGVYPVTYAVKHIDESVVSVSRSGGIFTGISDYIFQNNGVVYGCIMNDDLYAVHTRVENSEERNRMRGSKYIQSKLGGTLQNAKNDLLDGRMVLFSGTPCQIAGLRKFLGKEYDGLFCIDILCHGVPSPSVWKKYANWQEQRYHSRIAMVDFRNKKDFGWRDHVETLKFENGNVINSKVFTKIFYSHNVLRPACYECPYKSTERVGDISIADYWKIEVAAPEFDDNMGVSLVLINTDKGSTVFDKIKQNLRWKETRLEDSMQNALVAPYPKPNKRDDFWNDFKNNDFGYVVKKYGEDGTATKLKRKLSQVRKRIFR